MELEFTKRFEEKYKKIRNAEVENQIKKQIRKIILNPEIGKPVKNERKGTRELYVGSFRLSYSFENKIIKILDIYHKDLQ